MWQKKFYEQEMPPNKLISKRKKLTRQLKIFNGGDQQSEIDKYQSDRLGAWQVNMNNSEFKSREIQQGEAQ